MWAETRPCASGYSGAHSRPVWSAIFYSHPSASTLQFPRANQGEKGEIQHRLRAIYFLIWRTVSLGKIGSPLFYQGYPRSRQQGILARGDAGKPHARKRKTTPDSPRLAGLGRRSHRIHYVRTPRNGNQARYPRRAVWNSILAPSYMETRFRRGGEDVMSKSAKFRDGVAV